MFRSIDAGNCGRIFSTSASTSCATCTVFVPGWRWIASTMPRWPLNQLATLLFCTSSLTVPRSLSRTGTPLAVATTMSPNSFALLSCPFDCTVMARDGPHRMPDGRFTFAASIAAVTCEMGMPRDDSSRGSSWMRTAYFWLPKTFTAATPLTVDSRCASTFSA